MANYPYNQEIEELMIRSYTNLPENAKRNYSAIESIKLGHGGIKYISDLFKISPKTIKFGIEELKKMTSVNEEESEGKEEVAKD